MGNDSSFLKSFSSSLPVVGPIVGGLTSLFGSSLNNSAADRRQQELMRYNSQEASKARQFNAQQATVSFERQLQLMQYMNDYNSPAAMMERLKKAGLNPNLALGGLSPGLSSSPSVQGASGSAASVSPVFSPPVDTASLASATSQIADASLKQAEASKIRGETDILRSDAKFRDAMNQGLLKLQDVEIECGGMKIQESNQSIAESRYRCSNLEASTQNLFKQTDNLIARTSNIEADTIYKGIQNLFASRQFELQIEQAAAQLSLTKAEAKSVLTHIFIDTLLARSQNSVNWQTAALRMSEAEQVKKSTDIILPKTAASLSITNDMLRINYGDLQKTHEFLNGLKTWGAAVDIGARVLGSASMFLPGLAGGISKLRGAVGSNVPSY